MHSNCANHTCIFLLHGLEMQIPSKHSLLCSCWHGPNIGFWPFLFPAYSKTRLRGVRPKQSLTRRCPEPPRNLTLRCPAHRRQTGTPWRHPHRKVKHPCILIGIGKWKTFFLSIKEAYKTTTNGGSEDVLYLWYCPYSRYKIWSVDSKRPNYNLLWHLQ